MKSILALILSIVIFTFASQVIAGEWGYFAKGQEKLYGTWVNMDYASSSIPQKIIYKSVGTFNCFSHANSKDADDSGRYLVTGKWSDSEGNIFYKSNWVGDWGEQAYQITKISNSGKTLEFVLGYDEPPRNIDPDNIWYRKYTRK
jgi:hypothetical protein